MQSKVACRSEPSMYRGAVRFMSRRPVTLPPSVLPMAGDSGRPLRWRLHQGIKGAILCGQLPPGARLPSTRALASSLGVSRSTVVEAFDQLFAEGFLDRRAGSGTYVSHQLEMLQRPASNAQSLASQKRRPARRLESAEKLRTALTGAERPIPFAPCEPDAALFPHLLWARMLSRQARSSMPHGDDLDPAGLPRLRQAIAAHLALSRGVTADPEQVLIVSGARQALHLCAQTLLDPGDRIWCEDPGYPAARAAFRLAPACPLQLCRCRHRHGLACHRVYPPAARPDRSRRAGSCPDPERRAMTRFGAGSLTGTGPDRRAARSYRTDAGDCTEQCDGCQARSSGLLQRP